MSGFCATYRENFFTMYIGGNFDSLFQTIDFDNVNIVQLILINYA